MPVTQKNGCRATATESVFVQKKWIGITAQKYKVFNFYKI